MPKALAKQPIWLDKDETAEQAHQPSKPRARKAEPKPEPRQLPKRTRTRLNYAERVDQHENDEDERHTPVDEPSPSLVKQEPPQPSPPRNLPPPPKAPSPPPKPAPRHVEERDVSRAESSARRSQARIELSGHLGFMHASALGGCTSRAQMELINRRHEKAMEALARI